MHFHGPAVPILTIIAVVFLIKACRGCRPKVSIPAPPPPVSHGPGWITPVLLLIVACLLAFGVLGLVVRARDSRPDDYVAARDLAVAVRELKTDAKEFAEEIQADVRAELERNGVRPPHAIKKATRAPKAPAAPRVGSGPQREQKQETEWSKDVTSVGDSREDALRAALQKAVPPLTEYLRERSPAFDVSPSANFIAKHLVAGKPTIEEREFPGADMMKYEAKVHLELTPRGVDALAALERQTYMEQRVAWLLRLVGAMVVGLGAVALYVRLDEWSKGYYTGWLRLAAAGFITASVLCLWFLSGR